MQATSITNPVVRSLAGNGRIPELDGLRGIAILAVMIFHFGAPRLQPGLLHGGMEIGWAGVDLFFVLSGFLITNILIRSRGSERYFSNFYMRRVLRIIPLYYACVFAVFVVILPFVHSGQWQALRSEQIWYWLHLSNLRTAWGPFAISPIGHFWSLAVEEQFYFVWPLIVFLLPQRALLWLCLAVPAASAALRSLPAMRAIERSHPEFLYRMTFCRLDGLALGNCAAILMLNPVWTRKAMPIVRALLPLSVALLGIIVFADRSTLYHGRWTSSFGFTVLAMLFSSSLFLIVAGQAPAGLLRTKWLVSFGKYSYAMYLFHVPIRFALFKLMPMDGLAGCAATMAVGISISYLAAYASWHFF